MSTGPELFVVCKNCGSEVSPYITECPYCGTRLRKRAPKLDREGRPTERPRRMPKPSLGPLRKGEIPGIRGDRRPFATIALLLASFGVTIAWRAGAFSLDDIAIVGKVGDEWWRLVTVLFAYDNAGYGLAALVTVAIFGWLLERRHGPLAVLVVFLVGGAAGMLLASSVEELALPLGGNGAALALLCAWALPDLLARRRREETDSDLLGVAVIAIVLLLMPLAWPSADSLAGVGGALAGLVLGLPLARFAAR